MSNITIVLAADTGYAEQVHTLMKSICTHNTNVNFYLMHNTFRREWIDYTNQKLAASGSRLNDAKSRWTSANIAAYPIFRMPHFSV